MKNICLIVLVGIPAAGKTTFCLSFNSRISPDNYNVQIYHFDDYLKDNDYRISRRQLFDTIQRDLHTYTKAVHNVPLLIILDDNMMYKSMRSQYFKLARQCEVSYGAVYFSTPLDLARSRNSQRSNKVPDNVLIKMNSTIEIPDDAFVIHPTTVFNTEFFNLFQSFVQDCLNKPLQSLPEQNLPPAAEMPIKHKVDLMLRNIIKQKIKEKRTWIELNTIKSDVYKRYKTGDIVINCNWNENQIRTYLETFFNK